MKERRWGRIINVLNIGAKAARPASMPTSLTRAAGMALTKVLAGEGAPFNVLVNALLVGFIESDQWVRRAASLGIRLCGLPATSAARKSRSAAPGRAEEFANLACFLASDAGSYVTGTAINVDGGRSPVGSPQLILMFAARITGVQRAMSASMRARNCAGELPIGSISWVASLSRIAGSVIASTTSRWIFAVTAAGVPAGAIRPIQASASTSMPPSFNVGMPGSKAERAAVEIARIFTLPDATCGVTAIDGRQAICTSPRSSAVIACGDDP